MCGTLMVTYGNKRCLHPTMQFRIGPCAVLWASKHDTGIVSLWFSQSIAFSNARLHVACRSVQSKTASYLCVLQDTRIPFIFLPMEICVKQGGKTLREVLTHFTSFLNDLFIENGLSACLASQVDQVLLYSKHYEGAEWRATMLSNDNCLNNLFHEKKRGRYLHCAR
jgi:hypothetical protein